MADQPRTQKQIAQKYKDNLDYYRHGHFLRRAKLICFLLAVVGSLGAVLGFRVWGSKEYFNTGPISQNHARFANRCEVCHEGAEADLSRALKLDQAITGLKEGNLPSVDLDKLKAAAGEGAKMLSPEELKAAARRNFSPEKLSAFSQVVIKKSSLAGMDRACLKCHDPFKLHQPQGEAIALRSVHPEMPLVHADRCSTCHREHVGHGPMKLGGDDTCATCHADVEEMKRTRNVILIASPNPPTKPENRDLGDNLIRFLMPQEANAPSAIIKSYDDGHPPFHYEKAGARDPANIKYNHERHEQADIPKIKGQKLNCAFCHQPGSGGKYYEPVKFEKHCADCHSLNIVPELPDFQIPHGEPALVSLFVQTMGQKLTAFLMEKDPKTPVEVHSKKAAEVVGKVSARGITSQEVFAQRVFESGDPPSAAGSLSPRANTAQFFPPCLKCHEVTPGETPLLRKVAKTNIPDRWVHHGPFTHLPHRHMSCIDCHGAARKSRDTADILMPSQKLCAECHRPLHTDRILEVANEGVAPKPGSPEMAAAQRHEGGVKWECQSCHKFHAPTEAIQYLEAKGPPPTTPQ